MNGIRTASSGVAQGHARVGERRRIEEDQADLLVARLMDSANQLALGVALEGVELVAGARAAFAAPSSISGSVVVP